ncbi:MAG: proton-conducting transporter membrane subunit [Anaerolineales bacterium]
MASIAFRWLVAIPLIASPCIYLAGRVGLRMKWNKVAQVIGFGLLTAAWIPFLLSANDYAASGTLSLRIGSISLQMDGLSLLFIGITLILGTLVALFSQSYIAREEGRDKFFAMLAAMIGVMIGLACAADLFNLWIWFEAMAVTSYLLVAFYREMPHSLEAGVKYLVQSAVGSTLVLIGISLVFSQYGDLNLAVIRQNAATSPILLAAGGLFIIGFGVKTALVPLHTWLPDAHSQAPSGISAMLSGVVIEAGLIALLRCLSSLSDISSTWGALLMGFGCLNMLAGNLLALGQKQVKRMFAYSSVAHMGYMLLGLGISYYTNDPNGAQGSLFHLINHGIMKGLAFLAAGSLLYALHIVMDRHSPLHIEDLAGAARLYPIPALALSVAVLSLGGLPPLAGFTSKWQIFVAGFETKNTLIILLIGFAALNSVLSLAYYVPLVNMLYRNRPSKGVLVGGRIPWSMNLPLIALTLLILLLGVWPTLADGVTIPAGQAVMRGVIDVSTVALP